MAPAGRFGSCLFRARAGARGRVRRGRERGSQALSNPGLVRREKGRRALGANAVRERGRVRNAVKRWRRMG